jgi:hypothetical protein
LPFGEGKKWMQNGFGAAILGNWTISSIISIESGFPVSVYSSSASTSNIFTRTLYGNPGTGDAETDGSRYERIAPVPGSGCTVEPCGIGLWLNPAAFTSPAIYTLGTLPRTLDDVRTPHRNNWDFVALKDIRFKGSLRAELKFEVLNLTNTVKVRGPETRTGNAQFGNISTQSGFQRLTQLSFGLKF